MSIEDYREYCLSLGNDIEEKLPFQKFKSGEGVLVFYVSGHMFSFFDCNDFSVISLKCQPERVEDLKAQRRMAYFMCLLKKSASLSQGMRFLGSPLPTSSVYPPS